MKLQTKIPLQLQDNQIDYDSKILLLGSCFVENIGEKLDYYKFQKLQNPFGILFHPIAIEKLIVRALHHNLFTEDDVFLKDGLWYCFEVHSSISDSEKNKLVYLLNKNLDNLRDYLITSSHIILTYGTSWVYRFLKTNTIVANCFKIPQKEFDKKLLSVDEVSRSLSKVIAFIKEYNTNATIITTVSPVRHLKDGFLENNRSKAHLITAVHENSKELQYFPSYEIMMDELRDYRFYKEDMIHPNNVAISIIWKAFNEVWITDETKNIQKEIEVIQSGLQHKPFYPESKAHQQFVKDLRLKIESLQKKITHIKF